MSGVELAAESGECPPAHQQWYAEKYEETILPNVKPASLYTKDS